MFDQTTFELIIGPTMSKEAISALGPTETSYITLRDNALDYGWAYWGAGDLYEGVYAPTAYSSTNVNFYDRAYLYYHKYKASGYTDTTSRDRARLIVEYFMSDITSGFTNYRVEPLYDAAQGVGLYYCDTGSSTALSWLSITSAKWRSSDWWKKIGSTVQTPNGFDGRTTGRGLTSLITAYLCNVPLIDSEIYGAPAIPGMTLDYAIRGALDQILAGRDSDGIWRYASYDGTGADPWDSYPAPFTHWGGSGKVAKPWMCGLLMESMIYYDQCFEADARIAPAIQTACEYMYSGPGTTPSQHGLTTLSGLTGVPNTHLFDLPQKNFYYIEGASPDEQVGPEYYVAPIWPSGIISVSLNGQLINSYAYTYQKTGDPVWATRVQRMLEGIVRLAPSTLNNPAFTSQKIVGENWTWSYKTFAMLNGPATPEVLAVTDTRDVASFTGRAGTKIRLNWV